VKFPTHLKIGCPLSQDFMDILLGGLAILLFVLGLMALADSCTEGDGYKLCLYVFIPSLMIVSWLTSVVIMTDWNYKEEFVHSSVVENIGIVVFDNQIFNLSRQLHRNIEEGELFLCKKKIRGWYGGIYWLAEAPYEITLAEK